MNTESNQGDALCFSQKVIARERELVAAVIAETLGEQVRYTGAPGFAYAAGGWTVDRDGAVHSPLIPFEEIRSIRPVIEAPHGAGLQASGNMTLTLPGHSETAIENLRNLLASKGTLIKKSLGINNELAVTTDNGEMILSFYNATLDASELQGNVALAWRLLELAKTQRRVSPVEKPVDNEKYAFRCFLLRLGFIGDKCKIERKVLLSRLAGNGAFKCKDTQRQEASGTPDESIRC